MSIRNKYGFISLSPATKLWGLEEKEYEITRRCLKLFLKHRFPVHCLTKSNLILRDVDILREIDEKAVIPSDLKERVQHGAFVTISLCTLEEDIAKIFEPIAPRPRKRLEILIKLKDEGLFAGIAYIPVLPFISDTEGHLREMIKTAREYDADYVFIGALTLYLNSHVLGT